ncbi:unnamed protein product, partial [Mesorhabditis spiculigera]
MAISRVLLCFAAFMITYLHSVALPNFEPVKPFNICPKSDDGRCRFMANLCSMPAVDSDCPMTCHKCAPPTMAIPTYDPSNCANQHEACPTYHNWCFMDKYKVLCPHTCGMC